MVMCIFIDSLKKIEALNDFQKNAKKGVVNISQNPYFYRYGAIYASESN